MNKKVGKLIKKRRKRLKLTQEELAKELGVLVDTVDSWETNKSFPNKTNLSKLCEILNLKEKKLLEENFKLDNSSKIVLSIVILIVSLFFLFIIVGVISFEFSNFYWLNIIRPFYDFMFLFNQRIPIVKIICILFFCLLFFISLLEFFGHKRRRFQKAEEIFNKVFKIEIIIFCMFMVFLLIDISLLNTEKIPYLYNLENTDKEYSFEDIVALNDFLADKVVELSSRVTRRNNKIIVNNIEELAVSDLKNISDKYTFLKGNYVNKFKRYKNSKLDGLIGGYVTYGVTNLVFFSIEIDYNVSSIELANILEHELCHSKGIARENEATYCSIMAQISSDNIFSNYSGYLEAFRRVNDVLYYLDENLAMRVSDDVYNLCLFNNYEEICSINYKATDKYFNDTDTFRIKTYLLKNYENDEDFIEILAKIKKVVPNSKYMIGDEEVSILNIKDLINKKSDKVLTIYIDNDKKILKN